MNNNGVLHSIWENKNAAQKHMDKLNGIEQYYKLDQFLVREGT